MPPVPKREFVRQDDYDCGPSWSNGRYLIVESASQSKPYIVYRMTNRGEAPTLDYVGRYKTLELAKAPW